MTSDLTVAPRFIAGTSSAAHPRANVAGAGLSLSGQDLAELDKIGR